MDKSKVIELTRKAGYGDVMSDLHAPALERFAALIEAELRGDAEPVAYMMVNKTHTELTPSLHWKPQQGWHITWEATPLYAHPTPAVVEQLVEALEKITQVNSGSPVKTYQEMECIARAALAAYKENT